MKSGGLLIHYAATLPALLARAGRKAEMVCSDTCGLSGP